MNEKLRDRIWNFKTEFAFGIFLLIGRCNLQNGRKYFLYQFFVIRNVIGQIILIGKTTTIHNLSSYFLFVNCQPCFHWLKISLLWALSYPVWSLEWIEGNKVSWKSDGILLSETVCCLRPIKNQSLLGQNLNLITEI